MYAYVWLVWTCVDVCERVCTYDVMTGAKTHRFLSPCCRVFVENGLPCVCHKTKKKNTDQPFLLLALILFLLLSSSPIFAVISLVRRFASLAPLGLHANNTTPFTIRREKEKVVGISVWCCYEHYMRHVKRKNIYVQLLHLPSMYICDVYYCLK